MVGSFTDGIEHDVSVDAVTSHVSIAEVEACLECVEDAVTIVQV